MKRNDGNQGNETYTEIAYIYIGVSPNEGDIFNPDKHDKGDGKWDSEKDIDCGLDNDCDIVDEDGSQGDKKLAQEKLTTDPNGNGVWDKGEQFIDCGFNEEQTYICEDEAGWKIEFGNGTAMKRVSG